MAAAPDFLDYDRPWLEDQKPMEELTLDQIIRPATSPVTLDQMTRPATSPVEAAGGLNAPRAEGLDRSPTNSSKLYSNAQLVSRLSYYTAGTCIFSLTLSLS